MAGHLPRREIDHECYSQEFPETRQNIADGQRCTFLQLENKLPVLLYIFTKGEHSSKFKNENIQKEMSNEIKWKNVAAYVLAQRAPGLLYLVLA